MLTWALQKHMRNIVKYVSTCLIECMRACCGRMNKCKNVCMFIRARMWARAYMHVAVTCIKFVDMYSQISLCRTYYLLFISVRVCIACMHMYVVRKEIQEHVVEESYGHACCMYMYNGVYICL
jgi:hypothetical protein